VNGNGQPRRIGGPSIRQTSADETGSDLAALLAAVVLDSTIEREMDAVLAQAPALEPEIYARLAWLLRSTSPKRGRRAA
jgi:hypothetical protein